MKKISLRIALKFLFPLMVFCFITIISCSKQKDYPTNPDWLNLRISQMDTSAYCPGTAVSLYNWGNQFYYLIANPLANSIYTDLYDYQGTSYVWTTDKFDDFLKNGKKIRVVWSRPF